MMFTILSRLSGDKDDIACCAFSASSCDSLYPNCSLKFVIISGLMFFIIDDIICKCSIKNKFKNNTRYDII
ncbi:hypothetical protein HanPSC8_Chr13g0588421 [Helianthus annuus]|nr:hypothetical protein HanPSC8_Chr13g0588421 [Helianthus annuus]